LIAPSTPTPEPSAGGQPPYIGVPYNGTIICGEPITPYCFVSPSGACLWWANLCEGDLSGSDLSGADLRRANLRAANLQGADLEGATLKRANLCAANLENARVSPEQLALAKSLKDATMPDGTKHD
jgi:uncharacterized protein YjbI with pentapeptide repeats